MNEEELETIAKTMSHALRAPCSLNTIAYLHGKGVTWLECLHGVLTSTPLRTSGVS